MKIRSSDTSRAAERVLMRLANQTPSWRKVELMGEMYRAVRDLAMVGLRERFPGASTQELQRRLADILLGKELALRVYGPITGN